MRDFGTVVGFLVVYLQEVYADMGNSLRTIPSVEGARERQNTDRDDHDPACLRFVPSQPMEVVLGGFSYGALVLARLPPVKEIVERFKCVQVGTSAAEVILRARALARQSRSEFEDRTTPTSPRGRGVDADEETKRVSASPVIVGGEVGCHPEYDIVHR